MGKLTLDAILNTGVEGDFKEDWEEFARDEVLPDVVELADLSLREKSPRHYQHISS